MSKHTLAPIAPVHHCQEILKKMPYKAPFLFVDAFTEITENSAKGHYTYREDAPFYEGHFPGNPVTPGVIMIETMAQIGLVGLGMFLTEVYKTGVYKQFAFVSSNVLFKKKVLPGETVYVVSEKEYFRFNKLQCKVVMTDSVGDIVCKGTLSGVAFD